MGSTKDLSVQLPSLKTLHVQCSYSTLHPYLIPLSDILDCIDTPNIVSVSVSYGDESVFCALDDFFHAASGSLDSLISLSILYPRISEVPYSIIDVIIGVHGLQSLKLGTEEEEFIDWELLLHTLYWPLKNGRYPVYQDDESEEEGDGDDVEQWLSDEVG
ncbi:hypothetical protein BDV98DRAFT_571308 [Pterulicium gracile]|uniref:Uncharacterized protein n=1 Tax=Pterulicium gracile TaxID=1884261 RepID=A0A5C3QCM1_9AGAR|nr:hypothetical protein BDV98DRAFT_571308 [Pterula gracilis]